MTPKEIAELAIKLYPDSNRGAQLAKAYLSLDAKARALRRVVQQYFDNHFVLRLTESERQMLEALKAFDAETPSCEGEI